MWSSKNKPNPQENKKDIQEIKTNYLKAIKKLRQYNKSKARPVAMEVQGEAAPVLGSSLPLPKLGEKKGESCACRSAY